MPKNVDAPNVQMQHAVLQTEDGSEIVEKMCFDRLLDFVYIELMKGLQKGFVPKRCPNCGRWFVQEPGMDFNYCANPAPQDPTKLCRDIGATNNFLDKKKNHEIWKDPLFSSNENFALSGRNPGKSLVKLLCPCVFRKR